MDLRKRFCHAYKAIYKMRSQRNTLAVYKLQEMGSGRKGGEIHWVTSLRPCFWKKGRQFQAWQRY